MESGKSLGGNFLGRGGLMPYGSGNLIMGGDQGPQAKLVSAYDLDIEFSHIRTNFL